MTSNTHDERVLDPAEPTTTSAETNPGPEGRTVLELDGVVRSYVSETAVEDLSLTVGDGEILTLLGPSGCGKTTTLRLVGGLERPDAGSITLREEVIADPEGDTFVPAEERGIGLVFQDFALFPHMTAAENVGFGLTDRSEEAKRERIDELLALVDLADHGEDYPGELSGGQKQRIALARSLAPEPDVLLLDEPLSNLDVSLRVSMREEIRRIIDETGVTAIWVTHDQEEALSVADRVGIMNDGRLQQTGRPEEVFERPASRFVASFLGRAGFLSGRVDGSALATDLGRIDLDRITDMDPSRETAVDVLVRPDDLRATPTEGTAHGRITRRQYQGPSFVYRVETTGGDTIHCLHNHVESFEVGQPVSVDLVAGHALPWYPTE
ncbi:ABC transporter ATP-binding protein [Halalkalicoccus subterraneus]|uniref:ABC transporter ATP-binding protein n=1 Tax=Halalkalicoccus subterraneus TaxID=2675002 RepID=UPI000EFCD809|nr:ABC transporter ATP-binding protein [Halalkalicoccus subterraneus]